MDQSYGKIFSFLVIIVGLGLCYWTYVLIELGEESEYWSIVEAEITDSSLSWFRVDLSYYTTVAIKYSYEVDGKSYTGSRLSFGNLIASEYAKSTKLNQYPVGRIVPIYYDPLNPSSSVIENGVQDTALIIGIVGFILVVCAFSFLFYVFASKDS